MQESSQRKKNYEQMLANSALNKPSLCNLFAISKVGTPNMVFPSTLDVQVRNFQDLDKYIDVCDYFFPENSRS